MTLIIGVGVDIVDLSRFKDLAASSSFRNKYFSEVEQQLNPLSLAGRFAAREALYKASGLLKINDWQDVEIVNAINGAPEFVFKNAVAKYFESKRVHLTISHVPEYAISFVVIESE